MTIDIALALEEIERAEKGLYQATLTDGLRWERLGLGKVRFVGGRAMWVR